MTILKILFPPSSNENYFQKFGNLGYEGANLYVADPQYPDARYATEDDLQEIDLNSTAGQIIQRSNDLFASVQRPLVVLKMSYETKGY